MTRWLRVGNCGSIAFSMRFQNHILLALLCATSGAVFAQNTVGEVFASDAAIRGSVVFAAGGTQVLSGSQVSAGVTAAMLKLQRGGEVRICPGTSLSIATSPSGAEMMFSLSTGSIETDYPVNAVADTVLTPDFRMQMIGPGVFHLAIAADSSGNTCVHPLASNTASVIVTELMGTGTYQVKPGEQIVFPLGKMAGAQNVSMPGCGCPAPPVVERAKAVPEPKREQETVAHTAPTDTHVQLEAPFVFHGDPNGESDITAGLATLKMRGTDDIPINLQPTVLSPQQAEHLAKAEKSAQEAKDRELAKQQELAQKQEKKQQKLTAKQQALAGKAQQKKDQDSAKELARLNKAQEEERRKQEIAQNEQKQKEEEQAAAQEQARLEQKKKEEIQRQRGVAALEKNKGGVFKKIGSFFGKIFH